jgi:hypothetical protein
MAATASLGLHSRGGLPISKLRLTAKTARSGQNARVTFSSSITTTGNATVVVYANAGSAFTSASAPSTSPIYHFSPIFQQRKLTLKRGTRRISFTLTARNQRYVPGLNTLSTAWTDVVAVGVQTTTGTDLSGAPTFLQLTTTDVNSGLHS